MHIWAMNLGVDQIDAEALTGALRSAASELRMLEPAPSWTFGPDRGIFAAGVHTVADALGPRRYVTTDPDGVTFYSGLPVDPTGAIEAHQASSLVDRWDELHLFLEGRFCAVRVQSTSNPRVEVVVDPLGLEQVFAVDVAGGTLLSNSVGVLERAAGLTGLDPIGLSLFVSVGWVGSDRTLRSGVRVLAGGQRLRWVPGRPEPAVSQYFSYRDLATQKSWRLSAASAQQLSESLVSMVSTLGEQLGEIECPLTGGRDSRVLAALTLASGAPSKYYTAGDPGSSDVLVAQQLARELGLPHHIVASTDRDVIEGWTEASRRLVDVTDGMVSLKELGGPPLHVDHLSVHLIGFGGEIARSFFGGPRDFFAMLRPSSLEGLADRWVKSCGGLATDEAQALARSSITSFVDRSSDEGVPRDDMLDYFYAFDRVRRWAGNNLRRRTDQVDYVAPLCSRAFIKSAFSVRALSRYSEPLHYELLRRLEPRLHAMPFAAGNDWRPQSPLSTLASATSKGLRKGISRGSRTPKTSQQIDTATFQKRLWLEGRLDEVRDVCLGVPDPVFWDIVDRARLEHLLSPATDATARNSHWRTILAISTAAYYVHSTQAGASSRVSPRVGN